MVEKKTYTVKEMAEMLGVSTTVIYKQIHNYETDSSKGIPVLPGRPYRIPKVAIDPLFDPERYLGAYNSTITTSDG